jgi:hypothetical protein
MDTVEELYKENNKGDWLCVHNCHARINSPPMAFKITAMYRDCLSSRHEDEQEKLEKAEVEAFMRMKQKEPPQSPKTLNASWTSQLTSINMLQSVYNNTDVQQNQSDTSLQEDYEGQSSNVQSGIYPSWWMFQVE